MRCIGRECPYYHQSDVIESCIPFYKYITNKERDTACNIEDFHRLKVKYNSQIDNLICSRDHLDYVLGLVSSRQ